MYRLKSLATLAAAALIGALPHAAWPEDESPDIPRTTPAQPSATAGTTAPGYYAPAQPGGQAQAWPQTPYWGMPQPGYGYYPPRYPQAQHPAYPAAPAAQQQNPLSAELEKAREELSAKAEELDEARNELGRAEGKLQDCLTETARQRNDLDYSTREQQALRVRVAEQLSTLNTAKVTLEQQHQLISDHQAQNRELSAENQRLHDELAGRDEQLAALQYELQTTTQALAEAQAQAGNAAEALSAARQQVASQREALAELEAELGRQLQRLRNEP